MREPSQSDEGPKVLLCPGVWLDKGLVTFKAVRASGPGGQNVNRRSTKVELRVMLEDLPIHPGARARLATNAPHLVTDEGALVITCDEHRSQKRNREACLARLGELVRLARVQPKIRKPTKPTKGSTRRRLDSKRQRGAIKRTRRRPDIEG